MEVIVKVPYVAKAHEDMGRFSPDAKSFLWARVRAFSSNALVERGALIRLGSFVSGIGIAPYPGPNRAHLDVWALTDFTEWRYTAWDTLVESNEVDFRGITSGFRGRES